MVGRPGMQGMPGMMPDGSMPPDLAEGQAPSGTMPPDLPEGMTPPEGGGPLDAPEPPEGMDRPAGVNPGGRPDGQWTPGNRNDPPTLELTSEFQISDGGNLFQNVTPAE